MSLFSKYNVSAVVSGHLHHNADATYNGIHLVTSGPVSKEIGPGKCGLTEWIISDGQITYKYIQLDSISF